MARYIDADNFRQTLIKCFGCIPCLTDYSEASINDIPIDDALGLAPTADVVPKSEVEKLYKEIDRLSQVVLYHDSFKADEIKDARQEVAREIFEEIEEYAELQIESLNIAEKVDSRVADFFGGANQAFVLLLDRLAELKKKYTEGTE